LGISKGSGSHFEVRNERVDGEVVAAAAVVYGDWGWEREVDHSAAAVSPRD